MPYPRILPRRIVPGAGRGTGYSRRRRRAEWFLARFFAGGWAAWLARRVGLQSGPAVRRHELAFADWPAGAPPLTVGFASDFHAGPTTSEELLTAAVERLAEAGPDLVLLGGDFVSFTARYAHRVTRKLERLDPTLGKLAVLGNHDLWAHDPHVVELLEGAGVRVLVNQAVRLPPPWQEVSVIGLDDYTAGRPDAAAAFAGAAAFRLVLMHDPSTLQAMERRRFHLALAGHTHGGQVCLPGGLPIITAEGGLARRYSRGLFALPEHAAGRDPARLLVSVGLGCSELPVRLFAAPEVLVVRLSG
jgi:uncharacterized protein